MSTPAVLLPHIHDTSSEAIRVQGFLEKLSILSCDYNISIEGCGCCGSPFLDVRKIHDRTMKDHAYHLIGTRALTDCPSISFDPQEPR